MLSWILTCSFKATEKKSFGGKIVFLVDDIALLKGTKKVGKKTKSFGGKIVLGKKVWAFEWCLVLSQIYTKSFGGKNLAACNRFVPSKVKVYV